MSDIEHAASYEMFRHSLKKAADCAHKLAREQKNKSWTAVARQFEFMLHNGEALYNAPAISSQQSIRMADELVERQNRVRAH